MKRASPYTCDGCGIDKQPSNNWWLVIPDLNVATMVADVRTDSLLLRKWEDSIADKVGTLHVCGVDCALKAISKWMGGGK